MVMIFPQVSLKQDLEAFLMTTLHMPIKKQNKTKKQETER